MNKVAFKSFVLPFYQKTIGFWTLILIFGGVFMEVRQHILLGKFLFRNPVAFWILPISFLAFSLFHLRFQLLLFRKKEYLVFHQLGLSKLLDFRKFWIPVNLANHVFFLIYFLFLSYFSFEHQAFKFAIILWILILLCLSLNIWIVLKNLRKPLREQVIIRPKVVQNFPRFSWFILHLRQNRPLLFLLTKGISLLLLNGFYLSYHFGKYDFRWLEFGILCVSFLHIPILLEKGDFENQKQTWILGLPNPIFQKFAYHLGTISLALFPEFLFLIWKGMTGSNWLISLELVAILISNLLILQVLIYQKGLQANFLKWSVRTFFILFFLVLFGFPSYPIILFGILLIRQEIKSSFHF